MARRSLTRVAAALCRRPDLADPLFQKQPLTACGTAGTNAESEISNINSRLIISEQKGYQSSAVVGSR